MMARWPRWSLGPALAVLVLAAAAAAGAQEGPDGAQIYQASCAACHQADGAGVPGTFPPLVDNPNLDDTDYLRAVIVEGVSGPLEVNGVTYDGVMPALPNLTDAEVDAVITYLQAGAVEPADTPPTGDDAEGDPATGERLFLGRVGLENGGPACFACHSAGQHDHLGGAGLGPDLTDLEQRYGQALAAALSNPPSPTMQPVFEGKELTGQERADLAAFFGSLNDRSPPAVDLLWIIGLAGTGLLLVLMYFFPRRNRVNYLRQLRSRT